MRVLLLLLSSSSLLCALSRTDPVCAPGTSPETDGWDMGSAISVAVAGTEPPDVPADTFLLAMRCAGDVWYRCAAPSRCGDPAPGALFEDPTAQECVAFMYPCCRAELSTDSAFATVADLAAWSVSADRDMAGGTTGAVPAAFVSAVARFRLARAPSAVAIAVVSGLRIGCIASQDTHACRASVSVGQRAAMRIDIPAGIVAEIPGSFFEIPAVGGSGDLAVVLALDCASSPSARYPALTGRIEASVPTTRVASQAPAYVRVGTGDAAAWHGPCTEDPCALDVPVIDPVGPFAALGPQPASVAARLGVGEPPEDIGVDASFGGSVVVSDATCARTAVGWAGLATASPERLLFVTFPTAESTFPPIPAIESPRHLARLLRGASSSNVLTALRAEMIACRLSALAGVDVGDAVRDADADVALVFAECPADDAIVWSNIMLNSVDCAGVTGTDILRLLGTYRKLNSGFGGVPPCAD